MRKSKSPPDRSQLQGGTRAPLSRWNSRKIGKIAIILLVILVLCAPLAQAQDSTNTTVPEQNSTTPIDPENSTNSSSNDPPVSTVNTTDNSTNSTQNLTENGNTTAIGNSTEVNTTATNTSVTNDTALSIVTNSSTNESSASSNSSQTTPSGSPPPPSIVVNNLATTPDPIITSNCIADCFANATLPGWYYCSTSLTSGVCCPPGSADPQCIDSPSTGVACSYPASANDALAKYAFCPRKTNSCGYSNAVLKPLLNVNQTVQLQTGGTRPGAMSYSSGDVCYWELYVDPADFESKHSNVQGKLGEVYINVLFDVAPGFVQVYALQGLSRRNATNVTITTDSKKMNKFALNKGQKVVLIAYPTSAGTPQATMFQFTYSIATDLYPVKGLDAQLMAEIAEDVDTTYFWLVCAFIFGVFLLGIIIASFMMCCKDFDPESDFEKRRRKQKKTKVGDSYDKKGKKQSAKKGPAPKTTKGKKIDDDEEDDDDFFKGQPQESDLKKKPTKKLIKQQSQKGTPAQLAKEPLEIEKPEKKPPAKMRNDRNKHKDEFRAPLLDNSNAE